MREYGLRTAKVQQVHGVRPCVGRNINAVRGLLNAAKLDVCIEHRLADAIFQNLSGFEDAVVLLEKQIELFLGCYVTTPFLLIS